GQPADVHSDLASCGGPALPPVQVPIPALAMTLAASSQRSQIIRSKFRSVLQLRIHRRYQDPRAEASRALLPTQPCSSLPGLLPAGLSGSFTASPVSDPDPWISASAPALAPAPALPLGPAPPLFSPGVLLPEPEYCAWRSLKKESPKISQHWREPKPKGNLTYHQYMPPEPRQRSRADPQAEGSALGPPGPPLWEERNSQQPPLRMKPTPLTPSLPGIPSPSPPPHKLELQTLKLEELTVSELRQQLRLRGLPVSGTKSMLLERMRGDATPRERPKPRREDSPAGKAKPNISPAGSSTCRGNPCDNSSSSSGSGSGSSADPFLSTSLGDSDSGGGAAGSDPQGSGERERARGLRSGSGPESQVHAASARPQLLPDRGIDDILEDQVEPDVPLPPIPLDFPGSFDVLSPSPDSEGLSSVFSSSLPSPTNSPSPSPRGPTDSLDWLEALSGGPPLGCGPPAPSIFSADLCDSSGTRLWDLLEDPCFWSPNEKEKAREGVEEEEEEEDEDEEERRRSHCPQNLVE
ncbi:hypothetical protein HPG69_000396, partial [Diceros bicornis minor]